MSGPFGAHAARASDRGGNGLFGDGSQAKAVEIAGLDLVSIDGYDFPRLSIRLFQKSDDGAKCRPATDVVLSYQQLSRVFPIMPKFHRIAAFCVMLGAAAWIVTGEFSSVGSAQTAEGKESPTTATPETEPAPLVRTVSAVAPVFLDHAREIRLSGITEADKRTELAARAEGVIASLALTKGGMVEAGALVMVLEGPETVAQEEIAEIALAQKERDLEVAEKLFQGGSTSESNLTNARSARDAAHAELSPRQGRRRPSAAEGPLRRDRRFRLGGAWRMGADRHPCRHHPVPGPDPGEGGSQRGRSGCGVGRLHRQGPSGQRRRDGRHRPSCRARGFGRDPHLPGGNRPAEPGPDPVLRA
jgi:hypothetical protein